MDAAAILGTLAVIWAPGALLARACRLRERDALAAFATHVALGLAFWPLLFLFTSGWTVLRARVVVAVLVLGALALVRVRRMRVLSLVVFALVVLTRALHIRGLAFPPWVDPVHHAMIVRLLVEQGRLPATYAPFIPESTFYYHWGYHAVIAFVAWVSGATNPFDLPRLLLVTGQVLNALTFFAVYAGARAFLRSSRAALLAATIATLVSWFPAYYVSWGRYPQLAAMLIVPPLAVVLWRLGRHPTRGRFVATALLAAGLLLIHVRVAIVFAVLALVLFALLAKQRRWRGLVWCGVAAVAAFALTTPWFVHIARLPQVRAIVTSAATPNDLPRSLALAPHQLFLYLAFVVALCVRRRTWILAAVIVIVAVLVNLAPSHLVPNSAAVIMLFLPLSIAAADALTFLLPRHIAIVTIAAALAGAISMRTIVNPATILATRADLEAMHWIATHTPPTARFAIDAAPWQDGAYRGIDGGAWIAVLTGRPTTLPPGLYAWVMAPRAARETDALVEASRVHEFAALRAAGVTYVYTRDATLPLHRVYSRDGVVIYELPR
ncbi:MAG TPA: hypothetical protein VFN10_23760 [Thermoanaerobaculia bacterium]|nr:hypothetical protein [Thermoanaerobaculia bacterium]